MTLTPSYERWWKRLAGEKVVTYTEPDEGDLGFYRLPVRERKLSKKTLQSNGQWRTVNYIPVALYVINDEITGSEIVGKIGPYHATLGHLAEQWQWFVLHPISEEWWRDVDNGKPWPDFTPPTKMTVTDIDMAAFVKQFKDSPEVKEALMKIAQKAVDAEIEVLGATLEPAAQ